MKGDVQNDEIGIAMAMGAYLLIISLVASLIFGYPKTIPPPVILWMR